MVVMTPRAPNISAPSPSAQRAPAQAAEAADMKCLLSWALPAIANIFEHVCNQVRRSGIRHFCENHRRPRCIRSARTLPQKTQGGELLWADYVLWARTPHFLGASAYGTVKHHEDWAWRWSFIVAGVDVQNEAFGCSSRHGSQPFNVRDT